MAYSSNGPSGRSDGQSYYSEQPYRDSSTQGYGGSSSQGYGRSSNQAYRDPYNPDYQSMTNSMAKASLDDIHSWKDLEKSNSKLYKAIMEASKRLKKLESKGKIRPFKPAFPKVDLGRSSASFKTAPPTSSGSYYPNATNAPSYGSSKVYGCRYCKKDYISKEDRSEHEERRHVPCPYCGKECDNSNHRHDHKKRCPRRR